MVIKKAFDLAMPPTKSSLGTAYNHFSLLFYSVSGVNNVYLFVINYLAQRCHKLSKAYDMFSVSSFLLMGVAQRFYNFVPAFQKLSKDGTDIVQACGSCCVPRFCASIALAFLGVELPDYVVDGGICESMAVGAAKWGVWPQDGGNQTLRMPC